MIEINLLRPRIKPPGWQSALEPRDWSAFHFSARASPGDRPVGARLLDTPPRVWALRGRNRGDGRASLQRTPDSRRLQRPLPRTRSPARPKPQLWRGDAGGAVDPSEDPPLAGAPAEPSSLSTPGTSPPQPATSQQGLASAEPPPGEPPASPSGGRLTQLRQVTQGKLGAGGCHHRWDSSV